MIKGQRSLKKNFLYNASYQLVVSLTPLITTPYLARVLGPSVSGVYSYTFAIANYFVIFATLGVSTYGVRAVAQCGNDRETRSRVFCGVYAAQLLAGSIALFGYVLYAVSSPVGGIQIAAVWGLYVLYALLDVSWLLFGCEEFKVPTIRSIITRLLMVAVILLFVRTPNDLWIYCMAMAGSFFLNAVLVWPFVPQFVDYRKPSLPEIIVHLKANIGLFIPVVAYSLYTTINDVLLGMFSTVDQVAFYDYSYKISRTFLHIITALGTVMLPRMSQAFSSGSREKGLELLKTSIWAMFSGSYALMFGIIAVAPDFTPIFFGEGYDTCAPLMSFLCILIPVVTITNVIGKQYLLPLGRDGQYTRSILAGAAANVVLAFILVPFLGAWGAAIGTVAADFAILFVQVRSVKGELLIGSYVRESLPFAVIGLIMYIVVRLVASMLVGWRPLSVLLVEIIVGAIVYAILSLWLCVSTHNESFEKLFGRYLNK